MDGYSPQRYASDRAAAMSENARKFTPRNKNLPISPPPHGYNANPRSEAVLSYVRRAKKWCTMEDIEAGLTTEMDENSCRAALAYLHSRGFIARKQIGGLDAGEANVWAYGPATFRGSK